MDDVHMVMRDTENKILPSMEIIQLIDKMRYNHNIGISKGKVSNK
jgi:hypothetical protein